MQGLGRVAIIANPVAQSGAAAAVAERFEKTLCERIPESECNMHLTRHAGHAIEIASELGDRYDTIVAIGGDGLVHEAVNGLMRIPKDVRPKLAVVPTGSGNDYALTLGMSTDADAAMRQILECNVRSFDVGCVNGEYFAETLSFGIDAAIAIDTMEKRKRTGRRGTILYMESGKDQLLHHLHRNSYNVRFEGVPGRGTVEASGESYIFAVQIGKTYGGHFKICPDADPQDGLFDICYTRGSLSAAKALCIFVLARFGLHARFKRFTFLKASGLTIDFDKPPAAQADGEKIEGEHFDIAISPRALDVIVGDFKK